MALEILRGVLTAIDAGELSASSTIRAGIAGGLAALSEVVDLAGRRFCRTTMDRLMYDAEVDSYSPSRALGYVRVSTDEQAASGAGLAAQRRAIKSEADRRGWELLNIVGEDSGASSTTLERAGLQGALERLDRGEADVLVVAKLDRLSRSVAQGALVMERAKRKGWSLVALDFGLDTTTPAGEMVANVILSTAQYERRLIGQRTRDALAERRAAGVQLGRPAVLDSALVGRIAALRQNGASFRALASQLNAESVPTAQGGTAWHASTVRAVLQRYARNAPAIPDPDRSQS